MILLLGLIEEIFEVFHISITKLTIHYKLFEDNNRALGLAKALKIRPYTKHEIKLIDANMQ